MSNPKVMRDFLKAHLPQNLRALIDAPKELIDAYFLKPFKLIDLTQVENQELAKHQWAGLMEVALKSAYLSDAFPVIRVLLRIYRGCGDDLGLLEVVLEHLTCQGGIDANKKSEFYKMIHEELTPEGAHKVMNLVDMWLEEGRQEGVKEMAKRLLEEGIAPAFVARITGFSIETVKHLSESKENQPLSEPEEV